MAERIPGEVKRVGNTLYVKPSDGIEAIRRLGIGPGDPVTISTGSIGDPEDLRARDPEGNPILTFVEICAAEGVILSFRGYAVETPDGIRAISGRLFVPAPRVNDGRASVTFDQGPLMIPGILLENKGEGVQQISELYVKDALLCFKGAPILERIYATPGENIDEYPPPESKAQPVLEKGPRVHMLLDTGQLGDVDVHIDGYFTKSTMKGPGGRPLSKITLLEGRILFVNMSRLNLWDPRSGSMGRLVSANKKIDPDIFRNSDRFTFEIYGGYISGQHSGFKIDGHWVTLENVTIHGTIPDINRLRLIRVLKEGDEPTIPRPKGPSI